MPQTKVNGKAAPFEAIGRDIFLKNFAKDSGTISQANLDALVETVQLTSTVTAIGAFTAGSSTAVKMIIEGADLANSNAVISGYTISDVSF